MELNLEQKIKKFLKTGLVIGGCLLSSLAYSNRADATTIESVYKPCGICRETNKYPIVLSTSYLGSPDLDTRPPIMVRLSMHTWVERCPSCGYSAGNISVVIDKSKEVINRNSYLEQLNNKEFPELANSFLCYAQIMENIDNYASAGRASIHAAWVCDDRDYNTQARECRVKAVNLLQKAKENNQVFAKQVGVEELIMADLLRRSGQFESASQVCNSGLEKKDLDETISECLNFEQELISRADTGCYTVSKQKCSE